MLVAICSSQTNAHASDRQNAGVVQNAAADCRRVCCLASLWACIAHFSPVVSAKQVLCNGWGTLPTQNTAAITEAKMVTPMIEPLRRRTPCFDLAMPVGRRRVLLLRFPLPDIHRRQFLPAVQKTRGSIASL